MEAAIKLTEKVVETARVQARRREAMVADQVRWHWLDRSAVNICKQCLMFEAQIVQHGVWFNSWISTMIHSFRSIHMWFTGHCGECFTLVHCVWWASATFHVTAGGLRLGLWWFPWFPAKSQVNFSTEQVLSLRSSFSEMTHSGVTWRGTVITRSLPQVEACELQPKFAVMKVVFEASLFFGNWAGTWKNDSTLFKKRQHLHTFAIFPKPEKR